MQHFKITLDPTNEDDQKILNFLESEEKRMKETGCGKPLSKTEILKILLSNPNKTHIKKIRNAFLDSFDMKSRYKALHSAYQKINNVSVDQEEFNMTHLRKMKDREMEKMINQFLGMNFSELKNINRSKTRRVLQGSNTEQVNVEETISM